MIFTSTEEKMWEKKKSPSPKKTSKKITDETIKTKYEQEVQRILTENNRERLPVFVESLNKEGNIKIRPFYQRRLRWNQEKQSRLIESFLMNIPVPPIILYEEKYNYYEVMDGQQRITAIQDFYNNDLELTGLEFWSELNGLTYNQLPVTIKAGIDRRSISSIVLITESTDDPDKALFLKQITFERFNTGGVELSNQEVRNCIYTGQFNQLLLELAENEIFTQAWEIPKDEGKLIENALYKKMEDVELILRFFALRNVENFSNGMKGFLDLYMRKSLSFSDEDLRQL